MVCVCVCVLHVCACIATLFRTRALSSHDLAECLLLASLSHSPTAYMQVCRAHAALNSVQLAIAAAAAASSSARSAIALAHEFMKLQWDNWLDACTPSLSQVRMAGCMDGYLFDSSSNKFEFPSVHMHRYPHFRELVAVVPVSATQAWL